MASLFSERGSLKGRACPLADKINAIIIGATAARSGFITSPPIDDRGCQRVLNAYSVGLRVAPGPTGAALLRARAACQANQRAPARVTTEVGVNGALLGAKRRSLRGGRILDFAGRFELRARR